MPANGAGTLRDETKDLDYYKRYIAEQETAMQFALSKPVPVLFAKVSDYCFRIGMASYSAGYPVSECLRWFDEAVSYRQRFVREAYSCKFKGYGAIEIYFEHYSAGLLVGRAGEQVSLFRECTFEQPEPEPVISLLNQFCAVLVGEAISQKPGETEELKKINKDYASLPPLFKAVADRDRETFATALDEYLAKSWGPGTEKWAKAALKSPHLEYCGKWCLLAAALCRIMGHVPALSKKSHKYLPTDLIDVEKNS